MPPSLPRYLEIAGILLIIGAGLALMASIAQRTTPAPAERAPAPAPSSLPAASNTAPERRPELPDLHKTLSHLSVRNDDSHLCDKPADAYYAQQGMFFDADRGRGNPPEFLFNTRHDDDTINWANGFRGKVPVCLIVDEKGNTADIRFPQSPGAAIEGKIKERISGWRYKPGYILGTHAVVKCQLAFEFSFR